MNQLYLGHNYFTDIITFSYSISPVSGDLFISIPRVRENSKTYKTVFEDELKRVIIHGVLHILGYDDSKAADKTVMRAKENELLSLY